MEVTEKNYDNCYNFWMKKRCSTEGHDLMLCIGGGKVFYKCYKCGEVLSIDQLSEELSNLDDAEENRKPKVFEIEEKLEQISTYKASNETKEINEFQEGKNVSKKLNFFAAI